MQKWPNVPAVFGWLSLDRRGYWLIKNERITNPLLNHFIDRNYSCDDRGRWFFQNGPQRVFVRLAYAPWVLRVASGMLVTHTGRTIATVDGAWIDESGTMVLSTELGPGTVDDRDMDWVSSSRFVDAAGRQPLEDVLIETVDHLVLGQDCELYLSYGGRRVRFRPLRSSDVPSHFGFVPDPQPASEDRKLNASAS